MISGMGAPPLVAGSIRIGPQPANPAPSPPPKIGRARAGLTAAHAVSRSSAAAQVTTIKPLYRPKIGRASSQPVPLHLTAPTRGSQPTTPAEMAPPQNGNDMIAPLPVPEDPPAGIAPPTGESAAAPSPPPGEAPTRATFSGSATAPDWVVISGGAALLLGLAWILHKRKVF